MTFTQASIFFCSNRNNSPLHHSIRQRRYANEIVDFSQTPVFVPCGYWDLNEICTYVQSWALIAILDYLALDDGVGVSVNEASVTSSSPGCEKLTRASLINCVDK